MVVTDRLEPTVSRANLRSDILVGGCLAALMSATSILVLCYSLIGIGGNTVFAGALLGLSEAALLALTFRSDIALVAADYLFAAFVFCIATSLAINGRTTDTKEWEIFAVSLAAYPACRFISASRLPEARIAFIWITGIVVVIGAILTAQALLIQWYDMHGKPIVFGFSSAPTNFLGSFGFLLIALVTTQLTGRKTAIICATIFLPVAVFAASQVRFTFIAIVGSLCLAAILSGAKQRKYIAAIGLVMTMGIFAGMTIRSGTTKTFLSFAVEETKEINGTRRFEGSTDKAVYVNEIKPPSCHLDVNQDNSIAIRKALLQDAFHLIPLAGAFGFGLDSFMSFSCIPTTEVHNSALQALIEFGWIGGSSLILAVLSLARLLPAGRQTDEVRFVLCSLAYIVAISLAHGRTSRDILLFALLGLAAGAFETYRASQDARANGNAAR